MHALALAFLLALGDAGAGAAIFQGKGGCIDCHSINGRGGSLGPELSEVGVRRTPESLRLALIDPDAEIYPQYFTVSVVTKRGEKIEGVALNEDDLSIQLRDASGNPRSFLKDALKEVLREERSLMPSYASKLSSAEIDNVVAYLRTMKGAAVTSSPRTRQIARVSQNISWLTRPERDQNERPETLLDALQIARGSTVADLGAGAGYFTWRLAQRVGPAGKVIAVDVQRQMLDLTAKEVRKHGFNNVQLILGGERDPRLPEAAIDLVLIANAFHEFSEPEAMMAAVKRSLKPTGRLVVVEYLKQDPSSPISEPHKMSIEEIRAEIEPLGFELDRILDTLPVQHCLIFTKRP